MIFINSLINYEDPISKLLGSWSSEMNIWSIILKIALALILSAMIGCTIFFYQFNISYLF